MRYTIKKRFVTKSLEYTILNSSEVSCLGESGASEGSRTLDNHVGNVMLYH